MSSSASISSSNPSSSFSAPSNLSSAKEQIKKFVEKAEKNAKDLPQEEQEEARLMIRVLKRVLEEKRGDLERAGRNALDVDREIQTLISSYERATEWHTVELLSLALERKREREERLMVQNEIARKAIELSTLAMQNLSDAAKQAGIEESDAFRCYPPPTHFESSSSEESKDTVKKDLKMTPLPSDSPKPLGNRLGTSEDQQIEEAEKNWKKYLRGVPQPQRESCQNMTEEFSEELKGVKKLFNFFPRPISDVFVREEIEKFNHVFEKRCPQTLEKNV